MLKKKASYYKNILHFSDEKGKNLESIPPGAAPASKLGVKADRIISSHRRL